MMYSSSSCPVLRLLLPDVFQSRLAFTFSPSWCQYSPRSSNGVVAGRHGSAWLMISMSSKNFFFAASCAVCNLSIPKIHVCILSYELLPQSCRNFLLMTILEQSSAPPSTLAAQSAVSSWPCSSSFAWLSLMANCVLLKFALSCSSFLLQSCRSEKSVQQCQRPSLAGMIVGVMTPRKRIC